jgi:hypothetical protein
MSKRNTHLEINHVIHEPTTNRNFYKRALNETHANPINDKQRTVFSNDFEIIRVHPSF